jgi:hypothetical protein
MVKNPVRLGELKKGIALAGLLSSVVRYQAQSAIQHARATNAIKGGTYKDIRQAFTMETMSNEACVWELMIPCQDEDELAAMYPANGRGSAGPSTRSQTSVSAPSVTQEEALASSSQSRWWG